jgi:hypothetical protein
MVLGQRCEANTRSGNRCTSKSNDSGVFCGRHGGITIAQARELRRLTRIEEVEDQIDDVLLQDRFFLILEKTFKKLSLGKILKLDRTVGSYDCHICLSGSDDNGCITDCCKKTFCLECLNKWINVNPTCPMCREKIC